MTEPLYPAPLALDPAWTADTVAVQAGRPARVAGAPMNPPITLSSTYVHDASIEYGRDGNAGWGALEAALGALDGGRAVTFASGLAAATAIADLVPPGGTVVLSTVTYYGVRNIFERMQASGRLHVRIGPGRRHRRRPRGRRRRRHGVGGVDRQPAHRGRRHPGDRGRRAGARRDHRRRRDVRDAAAPAPARPRRRHRPALRDEAHRRPLGPAAGRGGVPGRCARRLSWRRTATTTASIPGALEAFLALRGLRTLAVRLDRAEASAAELARRLASHPHVSKVHYPGLPGDPQHERASRVLPNGSGSMLSFEVAGTVEQTEAFLARLRLVTHATSLGGVESLIERRARYAGDAVDRRPHPVPPVGRHRERRGPLGRSRRGAARRARLRDTDVLHLVHLQARHVRR